MSIPTLPVRKGLVALVLVAAGAIGGGTVAAVTSASAAESGTSSHAGEIPLTGTTLSKVTQAVLAEYHDATFDRVETDAEGVYEAHIASAEGDRLTVALDEEYAVTGTE